MTANNDFSSEKRREEAAARGGSVVDEEESRRRRRSSSRPLRSPEKSNEKEREFELRRTEPISATTMLIDRDDYRSKASRWIRCCQREAITTLEEAR